MQQHPQFLPASQSQSKSPDQAGRAAAESRRQPLHPHFPPACAVLPMTLPRQTPEYSACWCWIFPRLKAQLFLRVAPWKPHLGPPAPARLQFPWRCARGCGPRPPPETRVPANPQSLFALSLHPKAHVQRGTRGHESSWDEHCASRRRLTLRCPRHLPPIPLPAPRTSTSTKKAPPRRAWPPPSPPDAPCAPHATRFGPSPRSRWRA
jgi:hypothetical protein